MKEKENETKDFANCWTEQFWCGRRMDDERGKRKNRVVKLTWILTWTFLCATHKWNRNSNALWFLHRNEGPSGTMIHILFTFTNMYAKSLNFVVDRSYFLMREPIHLELQSGTIVESRTFVLGSHKKHILDRLNRAAKSRSPPFITKLLRKYYFPIQAIVTLWLLTWGGIWRDYSLTKIWSQKSSSKSRHRF